MSRGSDTASDRAGTSAESISRDTHETLKRRRSLGGGCPTRNHNLRLEPLPHKAIQVGLSKAAIRLYVTVWIQKITDITDLAHAVHNLIQRSNFDQARTMLPTEAPYPFQLEQLTSESRMKTNVRDDSGLE